MLILAPGYNEKDVAEGNLYAKAKRRNAVNAAKDKYAVPNKKMSRLCVLC